MKISRFTSVAALAAALFWAAKAVAIGVFGRDSLDDPIASALFLLGLLSFVLAVFTLAWRTLRDKPVGLRLLACVGALTVTVVFSAATTPWFESRIDSWVGAELNLWILAVVLLVLVARDSAGHGRERHEWDLTGAGTDGANSGTRSDGSART